MSCSSDVRSCNSKLKPSFAVYVLQVQMKSVCRVATATNMQANQVWMNRRASLNLQSRRRLRKDTCAYTGMPPQTFWTARMCSGHTCPNMNWKAWVFECCIKVCSPVLGREGVSPSCYTANFCPGAWPAGPQSEQTVPFPPPSSICRAMKSLATTSSCDTQAAAVTQDCTWSCNDAD